MATMHSNGIPVQPELCLRKLGVVLPRATEGVCVKETGRFEGAGLRNKYVQSRRCDDVEGRGLSASGSMRCWPN